MVLASALLWSCVIIITKFMSKNDSAMTILTFQYTFVTLFTLPLAIIYWNNPSFISLIYTLLAAIVGTVLHLCINNAYKLSDLSIIQPIWFTQLVFASFLGFIIFGLGIYMLYSGPNTGIFFQISLGVLVGIALGATAIGVPVSEVGKHFPNETRTIATGLVTAAASVGYF